MKTNVLFLCFIILSFHSCTSTTNNVSIVNVNDERVLVLEEAKVKETRTVPISELTDGYELIHFENSDKAFFKMQWMYFSEHYICVRQDNGPVMLFDNKGHFIHNVGNKGHGPGEYISAYDVLLDENSNSIYITSISDDCILRYDIQGDYIGKIKLQSRVNKGRMFHQSDSVLSLVHICFSESSDKFSAANITLSSPEKINYVFNEALAVNSINEKNERIGFNYENYAYRNTHQFAFCVSNSDTLYHYDNKNNEIRAVFAVRPEHESENPFILVNELPKHYLTIINGSPILTEKETGKSYHAEFVNDYISNTSIYPRIQDGYIFLNIDPTSMKEELQERLNSGDFQTGQENRLRHLINLMDSSDNDILFRAKLKD